MLVESWRLEGPDGRIPEGHTSWELQRTQSARGLWCGYSCLSDSRRWAHLPLQLACTLLVRACWLRKMTCLSGICRYFFREPVHVQTADCSRSTAGTTPDCTPKQIPAGGLHHDPLQELFSCTAYGHAVRQGSTGSRFRGTRGNLRPLRLPIYCESSIHGADPAVETRLEAHTNALDNLQLSQPIF